jgi:hypothetical protein
MSSENIYFEVISKIQNTIPFLKLKDLKKLCETSIGTFSQIQERTMFNIYLFYKFIFSSNDIYRILEIGCNSSVNEVVEACLNGITVYFFY